MKLKRWAAPTALAVALLGAPAVLLPSVAHADAGTDSFTVNVMDWWTAPTFPV